MLVLTRKLDESIRIGDDIKITVLRIKGNTIRLGIEAPRDVRVVRSELSIEMPASEQDNVSTEEPSSATVTTVVDSPRIAGPRLFVGKVDTETGAVEITEQSTSGKSEPMMPALDENAGPLRAFLQSSRGLTAV